MANTTYFGWETPDDTDLVKDGAAAIRTLGQAIDTSMQDLEGGTTGQILAKNSNADMDFIWVTNDVGDITEVVASTPLTGGGTSGSVTVGIQDGTTAQKGAVQLEDSTSSTSTTKASTPNSVKSAYDLANAAIPKSLVDAAGDLIYATADNTPARLAIGTAGQVLKVNSGATAPEWGTAAAGGGLDLISTTSFSAVSSVSVSSCFSATYDNYLIKLNSTTKATSAGSLDLRLRVGGSDTTTNYRRQYISAAAASLSSGREVSNTSFNGIAYVQTTFNNEFTINITNPFNTVVTTAFSNIVQVGDGNIESQISAYGLNDTTSYTGFTILAGTNITGSVSVYGYKK